MQPPWVILGGFTDIYGDPMKRVILCAVAVLGLSACAIPIEMKENQAAERQALRDYHQAERKAYRADEISQAAVAAGVAVVANKVLSDQRVEEALQLLEIEMSK